MKKILMAAVLFMAQAAMLCAATITSPAPLYSEPFYIQAEYSERYFEHNAFYAVPGETGGYMALLQGLSTELLTGMAQNFRVSVNLQHEYSAGISVLHVLQKMGGYNYNNFQSVSACADKKIGSMFSAGAGIRFPLIDSLPDDPRLIDYSGRLNLILRGEAEIPLWIFRLYADASFEQNLKDDAYKNGVAFTAGAGAELYNDPEKQKITVLCGAAADYNNYDGYFSYIWKAVPQAVLSFNGGLDLIFSVEFLLDAYNVYAGNQDNILFSMKANYAFNPVPKAESESEGGDNSGGTTIYYPAPEEEEKGK
ncbi:MAG TPA: hypothetical protein PLB12_05555 [Candidatus Goldiibacteriota bacterium]|nr:hypothetical protein [Candidatus Goldiibacteriota bacterium]HPI02710.1 hypothetical protein [Candidatus Goldiibacteriota bacterium]HPN64434.1 hypothetical protein [Candidatus Goldiibacteriota bacterium]HRQ43800.1 hypothetical protein [Candidatus Goldiibacteriota bacterium]